VFGYGNMTANTTPATEGTPGAGQTLTQNTRSISLDNFVDYVSFSNKVVLTGVSDTVAEGAAELAYRGALSVDTVISTAVDTAAAADSATRIDINNLSYMTAAKSRQAASSLRSVEIKPKDNGLFLGIIHSLVSFDLLNDASAGGFQDFMRYADPKAIQNGTQGNNRVATIGGVDWYESNAVPNTAAWQSTASIAYHNYVFGKDAFLGSSLGKTKLGQKNFAVTVSKFTTRGANDPAGQIAAAASYNFFFGLAKRPGSVNGFRRIRTESSIG
jgi:N4-gp56 family major capsid protein